MFRYWLIYWKGSCWARFDFNPAIWRCRLTTIKEDNTRSRGKFCSVSYIADFAIPCHVYHWFWLIKSAHSLIFDYICLILCCSMNLYQAQLCSNGQRRTRIKKYKEYQNLCKNINLHKYNSVKMLIKKYLGILNKYWNLQNTINPYMIKLFRSKKHTKSATLRGN